MKGEYSYKELYNKWEKFINGGNDLNHLRKEVAESWINCRKLNVNPFKKPLLLNESEIIELINKNRYLIDIVSPFLKLITDLIKETNFIFVLTDNKGNVLDVRGDKEVVNHAKKSNFEIGANRSESAGTNAISLAISTNKPIQLGGPEHYNILFHQWTCTSAPIHDMKGKLIGVLTLSGHFSLKHTHTLGMVVSLSKAIEKELSYKEKIFGKDKYIRNSMRCNFTFEDIIGRSKAIRSAIEMAKVASMTDTRIVVEGESGTGKEMFVQAIHNASSKSGGPFVAVNCGAIPDQLIESELFGYDDGAFTGARKGGKPGKFELANGGTLFLDEINSMSEDMQVKLLRVLQQNEITRVGGIDPIPVKVRVIAASNQPLEALVEENDFRRDLFYRLGIIMIEVPPLRERKEDIPELFTHLLKKISTQLGKNNLDHDPTILSYLKSYHWPGNIRELENYIERAVVLGQGQRLSLEHFPKKVMEQIFLKCNLELTTLEKVEKESIRKALEVYEGNISKTSKLLGITRKTLYNKIKEYNLEKDQIG
ncbi:sigma-54-dependent Fis family transcriptional regulator [Peribacillus cavernae]|uniref:Sigma-54-dependent Fis family transcriptional regulator n=1 Tax=Peribacillus cavernae TaxID=1674310 RepID=A0A3S0VIF0_9BACI|nr:sigma-54-dependent Fis family transcriptional regulator [Peribacillus cavernae]MDQ0219135.1 transcriptional regulator of acetoin/glycerol metabolism [Peribacillus cavernae]RUQ28635.1 sigma-54-dependent Fis family transcriptional regulator [Peribacillus cavernae]